MRLSEAIRLGSLTIQNPRNADSSFCAIGMAAAAVGRRSENGTTMLLSSDPNCSVIAEMWPWTVVGAHPWPYLESEELAYAVAPLGKLAKMFDARVAPEDDEPTMTIEALCDQVRAWEEALIKEGVDVEQRNESHGVREEVATDSPVTQSVTVG